MTEFQGFPARMQFTPVPNIIFSAILPQIQDADELKVLLYIFKIIYPKKGILRFVTYSELLNGLHQDFKESQEAKLQQALGSLITRKVILPLNGHNGQKTESVYFLNNEGNQSIIEKVRSGEMTLPGWQPERSVPVSDATVSDIFTLYEQNIGMLTPLIADELKEAQKQYPEAWIKDAFKEAVALNKRNWRYISRILENWSTEGKDNGTYRGNLKENSDPDKYLRGQYGHIVRR